MVLTQGVVFEMNVNCGMAPTLETIKCVDAHTKDIVNRYIHRSQQLLPHQKNPYFLIPPLVCCLIIAYYYNPEYFAQSGESIEINDKKNVAKLIPKIAIEGSIFGNIKINQKNICHRFIWIFKISAVNSCILGIGIDAAKKKILNAPFDDLYRSKDQESFYLFYASENWDDECFSSGTTIGWDHDVCPSSYGNCFTKSNEESMIKMELDTKKQTMKYSVDGVDQGIAFYGISFENDQEYTMAVSICQESSMHVTIELVDFKQLYDSSE